MQENLNLSLSFLVLFMKNMTRPLPLLLLILFGLVKVKFIGIDNGYINSVSCSKRGTYT